MNTIFNNIIDAQDYLEDVLDGITSNYLQEYYALFISAMAYWNFITLQAELAGKLHIIIVNSDLKNKDILLDKIYEFLINKGINDELATLQD